MECSWNMIVSAKCWELDRRDWWKIALTIFRDRWTWKVAGIEMFKIEVEICWGWCWEDVMRTRKGTEALGARLYHVERSGSNVHQEWNRASLCLDGGGDELIRRSWNSWDALMAETLKWYRRRQRRPLAVWGDSLCDASRQSGDVWDHQVPYEACKDDRIGYVDWIDGDMIWWKVMIARDTPSL